MTAPTVAVIDIGSNSIKVLVAARAPHGGIEPVFSRSLDARISAGISAASPRLGEEGMARGVAAVLELLTAAAPFAPARVELVATSAVRDAANGVEFRARVQQATGYAIRILSGDEEANGIGAGLAADPALGTLRNFHVFDLGGGSLECLAFRDRRIEQALSLRLGCVRLTEKFVRDPSAPLSSDELDAITAHVHQSLASASFRFNLPGAAAVGTGGTVATVRAILGARIGLTTEQTAPIVTRDELRDLLAVLAPMTLAERRQVPGLPAARADVFPTALATILAVADAGGFREFHHSFYNLRYGLASQALAEL